MAASGSIHASRQIPVASKNRGGRRPPNRRTTTMSKLASLSLLALLALTSFDLPTAPAQAQGCPVGAAAPVNSPPPPPPLPPGNNPGSPGDPSTPADTVADALKNML